VIEFGRIQNPIRLDRLEIAQEIDRLGKPLVVQFSEPAYSDTLLSTINTLCAEFKTNLEIRFYGHYSGAFDANVLRNIPNVRNLSVDSLRQISNVEQIGRLPSLSILRFGVFEFSDPNFLQSIDLTKIERLSLSENHNRNFDLAPLITAGRLKRLYLAGHRTNIERLAELPNLEELVLGSCPKKQSIEFLNSLQSLRKLEISLGGRNDIDALEHLGLETLQILRVQGLESLGRLDRFPALRHLRVEDQIKLAMINLDSVSLKRLSISNCKSLTDVAALYQQHDLEELFIAQTAMDVDALLNHNWPQKLRSLGLFSKSRKWNDRSASAIKERGLNIYGSGWH
jgi:protein phosphatase 1 regulatory subunit 7